MPSILLAVVYFVVLSILGEEPVRLMSWAAFVDGLGTFNVWYRLVMLVVSQTYVAIIMLLLIRYIPIYRRWADENQSSPEMTDVGWIRNYILGFLAMDIIFIAIQLSAGLYIYIVYYLVITGFFGYIVYKGLSHRNAYPEGYFRNVPFKDETGDVEPFSQQAPERDAFSRYLDDYKIQFDA